MMSNENNKQKGVTKGDINRIWDHIDSLTKNKISWVVFSLFVLVILGLFTYFATADASLRRTDRDQDQKTDVVRQEGNDRYAEIKGSLGRIEQALNIPPSW